MIFAALMIYSAVCIPKIQVNNDITSYLPENTETRRGISLMDEQFVTYATADVMISNITYENADGIKDRIKEIDNVKDVEFENNESYYKDSAALLKVTFSDVGESDEC